MVQLPIVNSNEESNLVGGIFCLLVDKADNLHLNIFIGRDETMESVRPSFLDYFERKEKENQRNNYGRHVNERHSSEWRVPQDGDYEFVSTSFPFYPSWIMVVLIITMIEIG